jgi:adenine phosphoribosyltransferase
VGPDDLRAYVRDVPDFPSPGILFRDVTPLLGHPRALTASIDALAAPWFDAPDASFTKVAAIESRGFLFGVGVAERLGVGFVPIRKPGKLPWTTHRQEYALEYGTDAVEMHVDAIGADDVVLVIDDVLATGGTAGAAAALIRGTGALVGGFGFLVELGFLGGRARLTDAAPGRAAPVQAVLSY